MYNYNNYYNTLHTAGTWLQAQYLHSYIWKSVDIFIYLIIYLEKEGKRGINLEERKLGKITQLLSWSPGVKGIWGQLPQL